MVVDQPESAGNGASMRAAIVGAFYLDQPEERQTFGRALAEVTHRDERAVEGALYVAEMAACCAGSPTGTSSAICQEAARRIVTDAQLGEAIDKGRELAQDGADTLEEARACGSSQVPVDIS